MVTIGIDPHKATHQAVAIDDREQVLAQVEVRADRSQTENLICWADRWDGHRTWAIESAGGLGYLLAQQLLARGERVLDVPSGLAARVRVLDSGSSDKSDPNDARSVAVAALRHRDLSPVRREDHAQVLRMLGKRQVELTSLRTQRPVGSMRCFWLSAPAGWEVACRRREPQASCEGSGPGRPLSESASRGPGTTSGTSVVSIGSSRETDLGSPTPWPPPAPR